MTIYVDTLIAYGQKATSGGRYFGRGKQSCHMATDGDLETLHVFAEKIGLKRAWFQQHKSVPHYDLTPSRRAAAVRAGAIELEPQELVRLCSVRRKSEPQSEQHTIWRPTTPEDWALCEQRARNWTRGGLRLPSYPWDRDPRETMYPPAELLRQGSKVQW